MKKNEQTMAFSNAERVMISRGRMFFSRRLYMTGPIEAHSSCFSCDSAGNEEEPGRDIPSASMALAIVLAVYIWIFEVEIQRKQI